MRIFFFILRRQNIVLELKEKDYIEIDKYCNSKKIDWFMSAWDLKSLEFSKKFNLKYNKIASAMIVDKKFLNEVAKQGKKTFISTGMSTLQNIKDAVDIFKKNNTDFELMHCVSTYPMKPTDANLITINSLKEKFNCNVGYSGHENGIAISVAAAVLGATSLERHITLDRTMYGSDQAASLEPQGLKNLITQIRKIYSAIGESKIGHITEEEKVIAKKLRAHIKI